MYSVIRDPHPLLALHLASEEVRTAHFADRRYHYTTCGGTRVACGGLLQLVKNRFYSHYKNTRRRYRKTQKKGSSKKIGSKVDDDVKHAITDVLGGVQVGDDTRDTKKRRYKTYKYHPLSKALLSHIHEMGHSLEAAQVPVVIPGVFKMTQADLITRNKEGNLHLWEVKTGFPVGGYTKQGKLCGTDVDCTKYNIWQLQLHYTRKALESAGVDIADASVIQVYKDSTQTQPVVKVHPEKTEWTNRLPQMIPQRTKVMVKRQRE